MTDLWQIETQLTDLDIDVPEWIDDDLTGQDIAAIVQGGCSSGAYMPAVTYHRALAVMSTWGDDVLYFLDEYGFEGTPEPGESWAGIACFYLSAAVELWAGLVADELETIDLEDVDND